MLKIHLVNIGFIQLTNNITVFLIQQEHNIYNVMKQKLLTVNLKRTHNMYTLTAQATGES